MKVEDVRPKTPPPSPKDKVRFTLIWKREFDIDFLEDPDTNGVPNTTEEVVAYLQKTARENYNCLEDMLLEWDILDGEPFDGGFEVDVEIIVPGQKRII